MCTTDPRRKSLLPTEDQPGTVLVVVTGVTPGRKDKRLRVPPTSDCLELTLCGTIIIEGKRKGWGEVVLSRSIKREETGTEGQGV